MENTKLGVAIFPDPWRSEWHKYHPFLEHLSSHLAAFGCDVGRTPDHASARWLWQARKHTDIIHLNWPEQFYQTGTRYRVPIGLLRLGRFLLQVRALQYRLVWTVHELYPHSIHYRRYPIGAHRYARRLLCRHADALVANCCAAGELVKKEFSPATEIRTVRLGSYRSFYPDTVNREQAREQLGLAPETRVFLVFGSMRPNRNPALAARAFRQVDAPDARLVIAGQGHGPLLEEVESLARDDSRVHVYPHIIDNDRVATFFRACDAVVMPGQAYVTSAVIMLALAFGRPVITQAFGCAPEMLGDAGLFYADNTPNSLADCLIRALSMNLEPLQAYARQRDDTFNWREAARQLASLYRELSHR